MQKLGVIAAAAIVAALAGTAHAAPERGKPPWLTLDRVEVEPSIIPGHGRVRLYASAIDLSGRVVPVDKWKIKLGEGTEPFAPDLVGPYHAVDAETAIIVLVQGSSDFEPALPLIREQLKVLVDALPKKTQISISSYGDAYKAASFAGGPQGAQSQIEKLAASGGGEPVLLKSLLKAIDGFKKVKPKTPGAPLRKIVLIIGDGRDPEPDPKLYKSRGTRADAAGVRVHAIAFSPKGGTVISMLGLGEVTKWANGTLRLARTMTKQSFDPIFESLLKEINEQYVLTAFVPNASLGAGKAALLTTTLAGKLTKSTKLKLKATMCGEKACSGGGSWCSSGTCVAFRTEEGRGVFGWILLIGGIGLGGLVVLGGVGFFLMKRSERQAAAAERFQAISGDPAAGAAPPPAPDPNRIVPQGPQGQQMAPAAPRTAGPGPQAYAQAAGAHAGAPAAHAPQAWGRSLLVISGPLEGRRFPLHHGFTIGKAPGSNLDLSADNTASSHHAHVIMDTGGNCTLVDLHSTNGSYVNGVRITADTRLTHGMLIRLGSTDVRFLEQ